MLNSLGKFLRTIRIERGELLKDMANKLDVVPSYLSSIENGKRVPTKGLLDKIVVAYGLTGEAHRDLVDAYNMSVDEVSFDMLNANEAQKSIGIAFARKFQSLNEQQIQNIKNILDEVNI